MSLAENAPQGEICWFHRGFSFSNKNNEAAVAKGEDNKLVVTGEIFRLAEKLLAGEAREHTPLTDQLLL